MTRSILAGPLKISHSYASVYLATNLLQLVEMCRQCRPDILLACTVALLSLALFYKGDCSLQCEISKMTCSILADPLKISHPYASGYSAIHLPLLTEMYRLHRPDILLLLAIAEAHLAFPLQHHCPL
jgi:hypothetical protein